MKQRFYDFLKANKWYIAAILAIIIIIIYVVYRERVIADYATRYTKDQTIIAGLQQDRDDYKLENEALKKENQKIQHDKDSISIAKDKQERQLRALIAKHKHEIDSLLSVTIPNDSVYALLQPFYPNPDSEPLEYPFAGSQIRSIYYTTISYPRLKSEYSLQTLLLGSCNALNKKYQDSELNYKAQIDNMTKNIAACDKQLGLKDDQLKITSRKLKNRTFWSWVEKGAIIAIGGYAILK